MALDGGTYRIAGGQTPSRGASAAPGRFASGSGGRPAAFAGGQPASIGPSFIQGYIENGLPAGLQGAIREVSFWDAWTTTTGRWLGRSYAGRIIDQALEQTGLSSKGEQIIKKRTRGLERPAGSIAAHAVNYRQIFNVGKSMEELAKNPKAFEFHTVGWRNLTPQNYANTVQSNFTNAFKPSSYTGGLTPGQYILQNPGSYLKNTVINGNVKAIAETIRDGKNPGAGVMSVFGLGLLGYGVFNSTKVAYQLAKAEEDGSMSSKLRTAGKTSQAFLTKAFKSAMAWEAGSIGFMLGAGLFCVGSGAATATLGATLIPLMGGVAMGALFGTMTNKALSYVLPDPKPKPKKVIIACATPPPAAASSIRPSTPVIA